MNEGIIDFQNTQVFSPAAGRYRLGIDAIISGLQAQINSIKPGIPGKDGKNGTNGKDGAPGIPGPPGLAAFTTGHGPPEGVVMGSPGDGYGNLDSRIKYTKWTGVATNTGWQAG